MTVAARVQLPDGSGRQIYTGEVTVVAEVHLLLRARSISRSLLVGVHETPTEGRVLSIFRRACIIEYGGDGLLALVAPELENGPLNIVLHRIPSDWSQLQPGMAVQFRDGQMQIGGLTVALDGADVWEPRPDWKRLRANAAPCLSRLDQVLSRLNHCAPAGTLLAFVQDPSSALSPSEEVIRDRVRTAAEAMWAGWLGEEVQLSSGAAQLAGLGSGLTPAGDDFCLGTMLCAWLAHPTPRRYCTTVLQACAQRTTTLSKAFLQSAAVGECSATWQSFLEALQGGSDQEIDITTQELLAYGHSSGADALAGFLWMGLRVLKS